MNVFKKLLIKRVNEISYVCFIMEELFMRMDLLPSIRLFDSEKFQIYGFQYLDRTFIERFEQYFLEKRKYIFNFFGISDFRKVKINLFHSAQILKEYSSQFIPVSSYCVRKLLYG